MKFKEQVFQYCAEKVNQKIESLQSVLRDLRDSAANETKSTAGDKHETALAMLQIEQENNARQLNEALQQKAALNKIDIHAQPVQVVNGSLVKTNKGYLFMCVALGKIKVNDEVVIALSMQSPLGAKLLNVRVGNSAEINGITYQVESIE